MRLHVGGHILKDKALQVSTVCGFCGGVGCRTTIPDPPGKARPLVQSTCPSAPRSDARQEAVALNLGSARMGLDTSLHQHGLEVLLLFARELHLEIRHVRARHKMPPGGVYLWRRVRRPTSSRRPTLSRRSRRPRC
ncbi:unnamed protein product [Ectocarpus sp. 12 AP-2014]